MTKSKPQALPPACYALTSALLFGASTPAAKILLGDVSPQMLAGLLYLGSGSGMLLYGLLSGTLANSQKWQLVKRSDGLWLAAAIATGGVIGPVLLMFGLNTTQAAAASLLLNLEGVFTALLAWFAFKENADRRIVCGMIAIVLGSLLLSWVPGQNLAFPTGSLCIVAACFCWALDNNLTRNISEADPVQVAAIKGLVAGTVNCLVAIAMGNSLPPFKVSLAAAGIGFVGYGISLTLFVKALRLLGTARTSAYFSTAPFAGAILSVLFLRESISISLVIAALLMIVGVIIHLTEKHSHEHLHPAVEHEHMHVHDKHHSHEHGIETSTDEPHSHRHSHSELRHAHPHYPDTEHRHEH